MSIENYVVCPYDHGMLNVSHPLSYKCLKCGANIKRDRALKIKIIETIDGWDIYYNDIYKKTIKERF